MESQDVDIHESAKGEDSIFNSIEELTTASEYSTSNTLDEYKHAAYLYYIARYLVALYEARIGELPVQVWNDYRNALDHFMRFVTNPVDSNKAQISRMEGHIQRAVLDINKYLCHEMESKINSMIEQEDLDCLRMIDNGEFYKKVLEDMRVAMAKFVNAKTTDNELGSNRETNKGIVGLYLDACFSYIDVERYINCRRVDIENAAQHLLSIRNSTESNVRQEESEKPHVRHHLIGHLIWAIIAGCSLFIWENYLRDMVLPLLH